MLDTLITNGWVADGTGNPARPADVAIENGRIAAVGRLAGATADREIDATGKIVCPGFVDPHSHSDRSIHANPTAQSTVRQGVTTEIVGNCGWTFAPVSERSVDFISSSLRTFGGTDPVIWRSFGEYLTYLSNLGTSQNLAWLVGHNAVRAAAGVVADEPTAEQLHMMESLVAEAMDAGALGLSTGLEFHPGRQAGTEELVRLNRVVGRSGGIYASHVRNRDSDLQQSTDEFLRIVREAGTRGEFSHLNVRHNTGAAPGAWERAVDSLAKARREGVDVLADTTPFLDGPGRMAGILPPWVLKDGGAEAAKLLGDPAVRERLRGECDRYWRFIHRGEWDRVRLLGSGAPAHLVGKNFRELATMLGQDEWDVYFDILQAAGPRLESVQLVGRLFTEEHLAEMVSHPLFSLGVDGFTSAIDGPLSEITHHPMYYAGHVHYLTYHVRERHTLTLEEAIRKMTSMPAAHFGLAGRGLLCPGYAADVVVFDLDALDDVATTDEPVAYVRGVEQVIVNGVAVVAEGTHTETRPGRMLLRTES